MGVITPPKSIAASFQPSTGSNVAPVIIASTLPGASTGNPKTSPEIPPAKPAGLSITPVAPTVVSLTAKEGGEIKKVVPGLKIIGLSSELKKAMPMVQNMEEKEDEEDDDEDAEDEEDSNSEEEEEEEDSQEDDEEEEGDDVEPPQKVVKPKGPLRGK